MKTGLADIRNFSDVILNISSHKMTVLAICLIYLYSFLLKAKHDDTFFREFYYIQLPLVFRCHTRVEKNDNGVL